MKQDNLTVINCSPKFIDFILLNLKAMKEDEAAINSECDFLFVMNDSKDEDDFIEKAIKTHPDKEKTIEQIENIIEEILSLIPIFGEIRYNTETKYEIGSLEYAFNNFEYEEYLLLQCSFVIYKHIFFKQMFSAKGKLSLGMGDWNGRHCYLLKFTRELLSNYDLPKMTNKADSVRFEGDISMYLKAELRSKNKAEFTWLGEKNIFLFGRLNNVNTTYVSGIKIATKYRGTWSANMISKAW